MGLFSWSNSHQVQNGWMLWVCLLGIFFSFHVGKKFGVFSGLFMAWAVMDCIRVICFELSPYGFMFETGKFYEISTGSSRTLLVMVLIAFTSMKWKINPIAFALISLGDCLMMALNHGFGIYFNRSMDACFLSATLPIFWIGPRLWKYLSVFPIVAIIFSGSSTALIALALCVVTYTRSTITFASVLLLGPICLKLIPLKHSLLHDNGRLEYWKAAWGYFIGLEYWFWGTGTGTFPALMERFWHKEWIFLHNDWFEIGFEMGVIGLFLMLCVYSNALYRSKKSRWIFASLSVYGFCMMTQSLLHNVIGGLFAATLISRARLTSQYEVF